MAVTPLSVPVGTTTLFAAQFNVAAYSGRKSLHKIGYTNTLKGQVTRGNLQTTSYSQSPIRKAFTFKFSFNVLGDSKTLLGLALYLTEVLPCLQCSFALLCWLYCCMYKGDVCDAAIVFFLYFRV